MPHFGRKSREQLASCHPTLVTIATRAIEFTDFSVLCGYRDEETQNELKAQGFSQVSWPDSKHNQHPSLAFDLAPYPIDWDDEDSFCVLAGRILQIANEIGFDLTWGGIWKMRDLGHFQLDA